MLVDKVPQPQNIPDNIAELTDDLEKLFSMVRNAQLPEHLDVADTYLNKILLRWNLNAKNFTNPVYFAVRDRILERRKEFQQMDAVSLDSIRRVA